MFEFASENTILALIGIIGGTLLGLAARIGRFCTLGALEDFIYGGNDTRMRMWGVSIGASIIGVFVFSALGLFDPTQSLYLAQSANIIAAIIGGLMFGYGMALCGNCGYGALARLGGGDLRSFVIVIIMGISAYVVLSGPLAPLRVTLFPPVENTGTPDGIAHLLASALGVSSQIIGGLIGAVIVLAMLFNRAFRQDIKSVFWALIVAVAIVSAWIGTHWVADVGFAATQVASHTFSAPVGDTIVYAMLGSALSPNFAIGSVCGVLIGAFIGSLFKGHFRWEACEDPRELRRQIIGAAIMGAGAVIAMGCSVGQGISAFSVLALTAPITFASIFAGAWFGLRQLIEGFNRID